ncbi:MAG TPA: helix-turn-helix transcriptional regulator [Chitinophagaceae bacterium]|nr:helix-turn-helix transcriptional regulator [Chitinophagaceae bacterium]
MLYTEVKPHQALAPYIDAYWTAKGSSKGVVIEKIPPDGCVDIIFNPGDNCYTESGTVLMKHAQAYLVGTMTRFKETVMTGDTSLLGVRFKPGAVSAFFKQTPLQDIVNTTVELGCGGDFSNLLLAKSPVEFLNNYFGKKFTKADPYLLQQIDTVKKRKGQCKVDELASLHCTTVRQLERSFKQYLGITPKQFINLVRCQHVIKAIEQRTPGQSLLSIAFEYGYYDHAHLTNDFKQYMGTIPSALY